MLWNVTLTDEQLQTVMRACEFYTRVRLGQFSEISYETLRGQISSDDYCKRRECMDKLLMYARKQAFPELDGFGHSYGVGYDKIADRSWMVYQVLRYAKARKDHPEGGINTNFDRPINYLNEPLPTCEVKQE